MINAHFQEESSPLIGGKHDDDDELHFNISDHTDGAATMERESAIRSDGGLSDYDDQSLDVMRPNALHSGPVEQWELHEKEERRQVGGAAVAGGIAGLVLAGPLVAVLLAGGAAAVATTRGKAGQVTRATGEAMAQAGDRLKAIDQKHHFTEKACKGIAKSADWITDKLKPKREKERDAMYGLTA